MYQGKSPGGLKQPIQSPCSFYYDYTEEFERGIAGKVEHGPVAYPPQGTSLDLFRDHAMKDASIDTGYQGKDRKNHERLTGPDCEDDWYWGSPGDDKAPVDNPFAQHISHISKEMLTPWLEKTTSLEKEEDAVINVPPYMGHNRRNADIHAAAQDDGNKQCEAEQNVQATASAKILAPNPISPTHQLRVTNSIPQLMKALPPLPFEAQYDVSEPCEVPSTDTKALTKSRMALQPASGTSELFAEPVFFGSSSRTSSLQQIQTQTPLNHSRFKVRVKSSQSSGLHNRWVSESPGNPGRSSSSPVKPKLKLKVSRNRMSSKLMGPNDPQVRNDGPRQYNSTSELRDMPPREVSPDGSSLEEQLTQHGADKRLSNIDEGTTRGHSTQVSDQFDIPYPPSAQEIVMTEPVSQSRAQDVQSSAHEYDKSKREEPKGYAQYF
ncbi:uncharacterized protein FIESC28_05520 [Fusarium coffeatum]|uniref:Uncharacterized protein n=1 Tax=Fusarium coffeatum TaxID=231269 RepID=A0A366RRG6_9HYPO|nr:uncharacterized protein FIESC28_05520 [Fusarium coffeatum]RBR19693.1 hypothetical protein FIESC28_05520 [Fusarium coffeatum]